MKQGTALLIFVIFISIVLTSGMLYFFNRGETNVENENWVDFVWDVDNLQTFLIIVLVIAVPIGTYIIIKLFKR